jgi:hypothetical protein
MYHTPPLSKSFKFIRILYGSEDFDWYSRETCYGESVHVENCFNRHMRCFFTVQCLKGSFKDEDSPHYNPGYASISNYIVVRAQTTLGVTHVTLLQATFKPIKFVSRSNSENSKSLIPETNSC